MHTKLVSLAACSSIFLIGAAIVYVAKDLRKQDVSASTKVEQKATNVKVQVLKAHTLEDRLLLTGSVEPWESVALSAELDGQIEWQGIEEGDEVVAGQDLVRIDIGPIRARLSEAQAQHELAVQELTREGNLQKAGISSSQALDRAKTDRDITEAALRRMQVELGKSIVVAPFDGVVDLLANEQAEFVGRGDPLVRLVQIHKMKVEVGIPERDISFFKRGEMVTVTIDALPGRKFAGKIHQIATSAHRRTRTFNTEIALDNVDGVLKPGMIARARLVRRRYPNAISIPIFSVIPVQDRYKVFVEVDGTARPHMIDVGIFQENMVHVTEGLSDGDRLIVLGQRDLSEGDRLTVTEETVE